MIDGSEKRNNCKLGFELQSLRVIERRSKLIPIVCDSFGPKQDHELALARPNFVSLRRVLVFSCLLSFLCFTSQSVCLRKKMGSGQTRTQGDKSLQQLVPCSVYTRDMLQGLVARLCPRGRSLSIAHVRGDVLQGRSNLVFDWFIFLFPLNWSENHLSHKQYT